MEGVQLWIFHKKWGLEKRKFKLTLVLTKVRDIDV